MYLRTCGSLSPQIIKGLGLQIANPQSDTFADCGFGICGTYLRTFHLRWRVKGNSPVFRGLQTEGFDRNDLYAR